MRRELGVAQLVDRCLREGQHVPRTLPVRVSTITQPTGTSPTANASSAAAIALSMPRSIPVQVLVTPSNLRAYLISSAGTSHAFQCVYEVFFILFSVSQNSLGIGVELPQCKTNLP